MKVVINKCFGGFGLSDAAYEWLIAHGVPVRAYIEQKRDPTTNLYKGEPLNEGRVIFDRTIEPRGQFSDDQHIRIMGRYWESWIREGQRSDPLIVECVETLGSKAASGHLAQLEVVEIPDDVKWGIHEYDGLEHVEEQHRTWS